MKFNSKDLISTDILQRKIYTIRDQKVMLDRDLAELYEVETGYLNRVVKRNAERFPESFMFRLTKKEVENLLCQFGTANISVKSRYTPTVFTEYGTLALSSVLNSKVAVQVSNSIIQAFVELRTIIKDKKDLSYKISKIETFIELQKEKNAEVFEALKFLMEKEDIYLESK